MASMVHEMQCNRLPIELSPNSYRYCGNISKFLPLTLFNEHNRSPMDSPPVLKKQPKMFSVVLHNASNNSFNNSNNCNNSYNNSNNSSHNFLPISSFETFNRNLVPKMSIQNSDKENKSILKKYPQTILRRDSSPYFYPKERPKSVPCSPRKVDFRPIVIVFHFDRIEGSHVRSESQNLTTEPKDRKKFLNRNQVATKLKFTTSMNLLPTPSTKTLDTSEASIHIILPQNSKIPVSHNSTLGKFFSDELPNQKQLQTASFHRSSTPIPFHSRNNDSSKYQGSLSSSSTTPQLKSYTGNYKHNSDNSFSTLNDIDFIFFEDELCRLWLRFIIDLGAGVSASDVIVKANLAGNRIRIVGNRCCGMLKEEFHERCILPMEVDPHMITARMDSEGRLFVEGLIITPGRKKLSSFPRTTNGSL